MHHLQAMQKGEGGQYGNPLAFLLASGCRIGEALGLRWGDVDWQGATVRIERQTTELRCKPVESAPKTRAGIRTIVLPACGLEILSLLAMSGVPVKVAQARAGHSTPAITMRVYQHLIGDPDLKAAEALEAALAR